MLCQARALELRQSQSALETVNRQCPLDALQIEMVRAKNLQVTKPIPQTQFVVCLELATMADPAYTLKILAAIRIASS